MKHVRKLILILGVFLFLASNSAFAYHPEAVKMYNEGIDYSKNGLYQEAIVSFSKATAIDPSFIDAYYNLGSLYEFIKDDANAIESFQELLRNNPSDEEAAYKLGTIYFRKGSYNRAQSYANLITSNSARYTEAQVLLKKINQKITELNKPKTTSTPPTKVTYKDFHGPTGIIKDSKGNLYVANFTSSSLVQISPTGTRKIIAKGKPLSGPIGLVADSADNIYVANYLANTVVKITPQGEITTVLKGVNKPYYLFLDKTGMLYVSEQGTNTVIKIKII